MDIDVRIHVFGGLRKTKAQTSLRICAVYIRFVGNHEDRFCRDEAHIISYADLEVLSFFIF